MAATRCARSPRLRPATTTSAQLGWALARGGTKALHLAADLAPFWRGRDRRSEGRRWLSAALAQAPADAAARGRALACAAILAYDQGDGGATVALATEAVELCRRSGDAVGLGLALHRLAVVPDGDDARPEALLVEALALFEVAGFSWGIGTALSTRGNLAVARGDFARAEALYDRGLQVHQSLGDDLGTAAVLYYFGANVDACGDTGRARALYEASVATARPHGLRATAQAMFALLRLADLASSEGRGDEARTMLSEAVTDVRDSGFHLADVLHWYGVVQLRRGEGERGVGLIAAAAGHWGSIGSPGDIIGLGAKCARHEASLAEARAALPPDRFALAWAAGERMGLEQAADVVLADAPRPGRSTTRAGMPRPTRRLSVGSLARQTTRLASRRQRIGAIPGAADTSNSQAASPAS